MIRREDLEKLEDFERAELFESLFSSNSIGIDDIKLSLDDKFDVVRATALDWLTDNKTPLDEVWFEKIFSDELSYLVIGRIRLYVAVIRSKRLTKWVACQGWSVKDDYDTLWVLASQYAEGFNSYYAVSLLTLFVTGDRQVSPTSIQVLARILSADHAPLFATLIPDAAAIGQPMGVDMVKMVMDAL